MKGSIRRVELLLLLYTIHREREREGLRGIERGTRREKW